MNISYSWLKDFIEHNLTPEHLGEKLTEVGLEVEETKAYCSVEGGLEGLVVGQVMSCIPHPNADKLKLCHVEVGNQEVLQIVCGAHNVAQGQKVIVALPGCTLYPTQGEPFKIKKGKIRGEESNGMICAEDEIGVGSSHEGIIVLTQDIATGTPAAHALNVVFDTVYTIGITPNRGDALSHLGVARDVAAIVQHPIQPIAFKNHQKIQPSIKVSIQNTEACARYATIEVSNINVQASPMWLQQRLKAIGIRPKNNVVDVTNYVMFALGQPLHAFDADKIGGKQIIAKVLTEPEKFITLDNTEKILPIGTLSIADAHKTMCIAGVYGGAESGVSETTTHVVFESAYFTPSFIRKTSKTLGLHTDAAYRFARITDINSVIPALHYAVNLLLESTTGEVSTITDVYPQEIKPIEVTYRYQKANELIGTEINKEETKKILSALGIHLVSETEHTLTLHIPTYKGDVTQEIDVIEEVARIYGLNRVPMPKQVRMALVNTPEKDNKALQLHLSQHLAGMGLQEVKHLSLTHKKFVDESTAVSVLEPLSEELSHLRQSLLFGGLQSIAYNLNRKNSNLQLFEFGHTYHKHTAETGEVHYEEAPVLGIWLTGNQRIGNWHQKAEKYDFFAAKAIANQVLNYAGLNDFEGTITERKGFAQVLEMRQKQQKFVIVGKVHKNTSSQFDIKQDVYYVGFHAQVLYDWITKRKIKYEEVSKFPFVKRDFALLLNKTVTYAQVYETIQQFDKKLIQSIEVFDVYEGEKISVDKKSYAISVVLQDKTKTLQDVFVEKWVERLEKTLLDKLEATLRKE